MKYCVTRMGPTVFVRRVSMRFFDFAVNGVSCPVVLIMEHKSVRNPPYLFLLSNRGRLTIPALLIKKSNVSPFCDKMVPTSFAASAIVLSSATSSFTMCNLSGSLEDARSVSWSAVLGFRQAAKTVLSLDVARMCLTRPNPRPREALWRTHQHQSRRGRVRDGFH